jgi:predicted RNA-binding protein associated with RNAse of E/G family
MGRGTDGKYLERLVRGDDPHPHVWRYHYVLSLTRRGDAHSLWLLWEEDWAFRCWYVQLWKPIVETATGIETMDHALDIVVDPDGAWRWWDEDDFDEAQKLGVFTPEQAAAVRAEANA